MERWLSWSKAHDWKSCVPYKGTEGSNPSLSAKNKQSLKRDCLFFLRKQEGFDETEETVIVLFIKQVCVLSP